MYFYTYNDEEGYVRWGLESDNHRMMADSGEAYKTRFGCLRAIQRLKVESPFANLIDVRQDPEVNLGRLV